MLTKMLKGSHLRKSRFHDHQGQLITASRAMRHAPIALFSAVMRVLFGRRSDLPWISYDAIAELDQFLDKEKNVLEYGSGMSTAWYAKRAGRVLSIENYAPWYEKVSAMFERNGIRNVDYRFANSEDEYLSLPDKNSMFDFIMVDGSFRDRCTSVAIERLKPGGIFYLDNSDRAAFKNSPEAEAKRIALDYAKKYGCEIRYFTDFAPSNFFVQEGMMVIRPK